ncbi:FeoB-associated Cys-rich membrane protein [Intestinimonas sp. HCP28S3_D6]
METIIVGAIVLAILGLAARSVIKGHKEGGCSGCGGSCGGSCHCSGEHH